MLHGKPFRTKGISIHALREESDACNPLLRGQAIFISIHALREESDMVHKGGEGMREVFLSTLSVRRATKLTSTTRTTRPYFYPRSP